ncbi:hypothetical protein AAF712_001911 [Marasmius tenuissimus]|uniref:Uncharacterized protein n=1 Tax=Marasmius tenuissimus TaxID=585030 RepID=A0ABR3AB27_9AGAR
MSEKIPLPKFLKVLTSGNVPVAKAMNVSSKIYKQCNTAGQLSELDDLKLKAYGVDEKDVRKLVLAAVKKAGYGSNRKRTSAENGQPTASTSYIPPSPSLSTVDALITPTKRKRKRNEEVNEFLPKAPDEAAGYGSLDFNEILDENVLRTKSVVINRAPLMTLWATMVAERMGFKREEALTIASVYTEMNAISKGVSLGIFEEGKKRDSTLQAEAPNLTSISSVEECTPLYQTQDEEWRALLHSTPAKPSAAFGYISRSFRQTTPHVAGSLRLLADSYSPNEINGKAWSLYVKFRPDVNEWGKRSKVECSDILNLRKPVGDGDPECEGSKDENTQNIKYEEIDEDLEHDRKRQKESRSLEGSPTSTDI